MGEEEEEKVKWEESRRNLRLAGEGGREGYDCACSGRERRVIIIKAKVRLAAGAHSNHVGFGFVKERKK